MSKGYAKRAKAFIGCMFLAVAFIVSAHGALPQTFSAARAETGGVTPASFITADGAAVTEGKLNTGAAADDGYDVTGLTAEGGAGYSVALNGVFRDDVKLDFALLSKVATDDNPQNFGGQGAFSFRVTDAGDSTSYFDILLQPVNFWGVWHNVAYVKYGNEIRWRQHGANGGGGIFNTDIVADAGNSLYAWAAIPMNGADGNTENSYIRLSWTGDILNVSVMCGHNYNVEGQRYEIVIASFDGTAALNSAAKEFGLEKLTGMKENGFTVSFGSDYTDGTNPENDGTDICLTKLTVGNVPFDLTGSAVFEETPQWYSDYVNRVSIALSEAPMRYWKPALGGYFVPSAIYTVGSDTQKLPVGKAEFVPADGGAAIAAEVGGKVYLPKGEYILRYTAVADGTAAGNAVGYPVTVSDYILTENLLALQGDAKAESGKTTDGAYPVTGLTVSGGTGYQAAFAGTFSGNTKLSFALLSHSIEKGSFTFKVASEADPSDFFEICIVPSTWERTTVYVKYKNDYRMATDGSLFYHATSINDLPDLAGNNGYTWVAIPLAGTQKDTANSYISLEWEEDVLCVRAVSAHTNSGYTIAKFDGLTDRGEISHVDEANKDVYENCCLPKLDWTAYTISFSSDYTDEVEPANNGTDVCFTAINGVSLGTKFITDASGAPVIPQNAVISEVETTVMENATVDNVSGDYGVTVSYDGVSLGSFTSNKMTESLLADEINSRLIDFREYNDYTLHYSFADAAEKQQTLSVVDAPAVLKWKNGVADAQTVLSGTNLVFSAADIEATDLVDGVLALTESNLLVTVRAPGGQNAQKIQLGAAYSPEILGEYEIVYTVTDNTGKQSSLIRTLKVVDGNVPVIVLDGDVPQSAVLGSTFTLPAASAKDGDKGISVVCSALFTDAKGNKTVLDISGGTLSFDKAGTYTVSWYAVDEDGNEALQSFTVRVGEDKEPPVISVGELPAEAQVGDVITLPAYSAEDAVSGACEVNITVTLGSEQIALDGNSFRAEKEGVYAVRFTAVDEAGNYVALDPVYIRVTGSSGGNTGMIIGLSVGGAVIVAAAVVLTVVFVKKKKGKNAEVAASETETDDPASER